MRTPLAGVQNFVLLSHSYCASVLTITHIMFIGASKSVKIEIECQ